MDFTDLATVKAWLGLPAAAGPSDDLIGALIMSVLRNGSQQMGWPNYFQEIIIGLVIIVAVFLDRFRRGAKT